MFFTTARETFASRLGNRAALMVAGLLLSGIAVSSFSSSAQAKPGHHSHSAPTAKVKTVRGATVRVGTAFLRTGPDESKGGRALLDKGRAARVIGEKGGWLRLRLDSGTEGWVRSDLLKVKEKQFKIAQAPTKPKKIAKKVVLAKATKPKTSKVTKIASHTTAKTVPSAKVVVASHSVDATVAEERNTRFDRAAHAKIALRISAAQPIADATPAPEKDEPIALPARELTSSNVPSAARHVDEEEVGEDAPTSDVPSVVRDAVAAVRPQVDSRGARRARTALGYRGAAYRSGATGRGGFDCSGFMVFLFAREGVSLPRTASEQFHVGQKIDKNGLQAGDMVFFKNTYKSGISHVGMYIGNGQFIHAANHRLGVKVDALSSTYYSNHWAGARRAR